MEIAEILGEFALIGTIAEDIPQLVIQIWSLGVSSISVITIVSICASVVSILFWIMRRSMMALRVRKGVKGKHGKMKEVQNGTEIGFLPLKESKSALEN